LSGRRGRGGLGARRASGRLARGFRGAGAGGCGHSPGSACAPACASAAAARSSRSSSRTSGRSCSIRASSSLRTRFNKSVIAAPA
jgi:hypothetical protein